MGYVEGGMKICKCHKKSNFQNYGTMVVDSLKRPSRRVEKENIKHRTHSFLILIRFYYSITLFYHKCILVILLTLCSPCIQSDVNKIYQFAYLYLLIGQKIDI